VIDSQQWRRSDGAGRHRRQSMPPLTSALVTLDQKDFVDFRPDGLDLVESSE